MSEIYPENSDIKALRTMSIDRLMITHQEHSKCNKIETHLVFHCPLIITYLMLHKDYKYAGIRMSWGNHTYGRLL